MWLLPGLVLVLAVTLRRRILMTLHSSAVPGYTLITTFPNERATVAPACFSLLVAFTAAFLGLLWIQPKEQVPTGTHRSQHRGAEP